MHFALLALLMLQAQSGVSDSGFHPDKQREIVERSKDYTVKLRVGGPNLKVIVEKVGRPSAELALPAEMVQVDQIDFVGVQKLAILGAVNGDVSVVVLLDLVTSAVQDKFYCYAPALSPNKKLLVFVKFFPAHFVDGVSDEYVLYDFRKSPSENRPPGIPNSDVQNVGTVVFPTGSVNRRGDNTGLAESEIRVLESGAFFWSKDGQRLAFADRFRGVTSLVVASFSENAILSNVKASEIKKGDVCLSPEIEQCTFSISSIQFVNQKYFKLKLKSDNFRYPVRSEIDLEM